MPVLMNSQGPPSDAFKTLVERVALLEASLRRCGCEPAGIFAKGMRPEMGIQKGALPMNEKVMRHFQRMKLAKEQSRKLSEEPEDKAAEEEWKAAKRDSKVSSRMNGEPRLQQQNSKIQLPKGQAVVSE
eukprot:gene15825-17421_t